MSESAYKPAGTYELESFSIQSFTTDTSLDAGDPRRATMGTGASASTKVEMKAVISSFEIDESITSGAVSGRAKVFDASGIIYNFPFRGQELITIKYKDYKEVMHEDVMFLNSIDNIKPAKSSDDTILEYELHFVSLGKFLSDRYQLRKCFANGSGSGRTYIPIHEQVEEIFNSYYTGSRKEIEIHDTVGPQQIVIPNLVPENAMHLLSRKAYSEEYPMSMYRFYETREKYYFINFEERYTFDYSNREVPIYFYSSENADNSPEGELLKMQNIISISFPTFVNTIEMMNSGFYYRKLNELDIMNRVENSYEYVHELEVSDFEYPDFQNPNGKKNIRSIHTSDMIQSHMNKWHRTYVIKDYPDSDQSNAPGLRPKPYYGEVYNNKTANHLHFGKSRVNIRIYGSNELFAGDLIYLDLKKFSMKRELDEERSGVYLIESIKNTFYENTFYQDLSLVKGGIIGKYESPANANAGGGAPAGGGGGGGTTAPADTPPQTTEQVEEFFRGIGGNSVAPTLPTGGGPG